MKCYVWPAIFLIFAIIEYLHSQPICGSTFVTGQMWFMWLCMSIASFKISRTL